MEGSDKGRRLNCGWDYLAVALVAFPNGLMLDTWCNSKKEARDLLRKATSWTRERGQGQVRLRSNLSPLPCCKILRGEVRMEVFKVSKASLRTVDELQAYHQRIRPFILKRLEEFRQTWEQGEEAVFEELVFCLLTAGASALMGLRGVDAIRPVLWTATVEELAERLHFHLYPFARAQYIVAAREVVQKELNGQLRQWITQWQDPLERRDAFVRKFRGIGYKEASHFLRNIGFRGYAILDKHILRSLHAFGVLDSERPPSTRNRYLDSERRYLAFAEQVGIDPDELDLTLWASRTGMIVK